MQLDDYVIEVRRTANVGEGTREHYQALCGMGLAGEAGEVCDMLKKSVFHGHDLERSELVKELGDVLWYMVALAESERISMGEIMQANTDKLRARYPDGWDPERSRNRNEVSP